MDDFLSETVGQLLENETGYFSMMDYLQRWDIGIIGIIIGILDNFNVVISQ